ncbi:hypothetical protein RR46_09172 [Papilio xuthus]|uniref:Uncharacterized protein n=1 Tax=Papilio xuthus TaxID=66420 RepID=A0A194Q1I9_PAPXU|nr:hypothetical protein RR46_09172 [Papilio xuthus]
MAVISHMVNLSNGTIIIPKCIGINFIDFTNIPNQYETTQSYLHLVSDTNGTIPPLDASTRDTKRRFMVVSPKPVFLRQEEAEEEKDASLKNKIKLLVQQCIHDAKDKMETIDSLKDKYKDDPSYKVGFIFHNLKKSKDVMSELFNVAVKHRHDWKALEQMRIFELIVHTNVDTTNLVRQLVELHLHNVNATNPAPNVVKKRVVLL